VCDCQPNPVRAVLDRLSLEQVQSALETAVSRREVARKARDIQLAEILGRVVSGCEDELQDRLAVILARGIVKESGEAERQAKAMLGQVMNG
jgi:hypothetical protein